MLQRIGLWLMLIAFFACKKSDTGGTGPAPQPGAFLITNAFVDQATVPGNNKLTNIALNPTIRLQFNNKLNRNSVSGTVSLRTGSGTASLNVDYEQNDSTLVIRPAQPLQHISKYVLSISTGLQSVANTGLYQSKTINLVTKIDSTDKFPVLTDDALLTLVQQRTFKYFWDFGHPVSGLARERNTSGETVTSGGSGFGIMTIPVGITRGFITRAQGLARLQTIVSFLKNTAQKYHGAFPHWLNGTTGATIPFSTNDNGADLVETSYLMQGLITARQYFDGADPAETTLRSDITTLYNNVEWSWFRQNNQQVLYWHWSPSVGWAMNFQIRGWNECLITYVMAASSTTYGIPRTVYDQGWANNGSIRNGNSYYGYTLPLGEANGGPLFFAHYSFLGINPTQLTDAYANYFTQNRNHSLINYSYCVSNPAQHFGYSNQCWGLTASDIENGYTASSPSNDQGFIAPTAALSSMPYTPTESMNALKFFYYKLGDKLWGEYGFVDAFSLESPWFADSFLAIDQGPIVVMIENYRTGLLWNLFTSAPEIKDGMRSLGFTAPYL
jgi:hypothetical protein